jgi:hypothetical protein
LPLKISELDGTICSAGVKEHFMSRSSLCLCAMLMLSLHLPRSAGAVSEPENCKVYYAIAPLDQSVVQLLGPSVAPANPNFAASPAYRELRDWNFPSKVTPWRDRPSPEEIAKRRNALLNPASGDKSKKTSTAPWVRQEYGLLPLAPREWNDLEKWFGKEAPKKLSGACVDSAKATYVVAVGLIVDGSAGRSLDNSTVRNEFKQTTTALQQDGSIGANAASVSPGVKQADSEEMSGMGGSDSSHPGTYTCTYFYRSDGRPAAQAGSLPLIPEYYYCKSGGGMPKSAIDVMLKYVAAR